MSSSTSKLSKPESIQFFPSQIGGQASSPLVSTGPPFALLWHDTISFFKYSRYLPNIILPLYPCRSRQLDEEYPSLQNIYIITLHLISIVFQLGFIFSLFLLFSLPFPIYAAWFVGFILFNQFYCRLLNGYIPAAGLQSTVNETTKKWTPRPSEAWIFLNGVAVGQHWLQSAIDRLSLTFHRPIVGIHNKTSGIVFDVFQCLIQRCFRYYTSDVRDCYILLKQALYREEIEKVVFIAHSQGGIEGSMILDWLLEEVPQDLLRRLEVYTFGNAANHFNNPLREGSGDPMDPKSQRAIAHIEHYANSRDFVAKWGVLDYVGKSVKGTGEENLESRFMGRVFVRDGSGHQLVQHYLDWMFPLDEQTMSFTRDARPGDFMDSEVELGAEGAGRESLGQCLQATHGGSISLNGLVDEMLNIPGGIVEQLPGLDDKQNDEALLLNTDPWSFSVKTSNGKVSATETGMLYKPSNGHNLSLKSSTNGNKDNENGIPVQKPVDEGTYKVSDFSRLWMYRNGMSPPEDKTI